MPRKKEVVTKLLEALNYTLLFFLTVEMLFSLKGITTIARIDGFIIFSALMFSLYFLVKKRPLLISGAILTLLYTLYYLYYLKELTLYAWLKEFTWLIFNDIQLLTMGNWQDISYEFKTLLFLLFFLWSLIYLLVSVSKKNKSLWLLLILAGYFSVIDSMYSYDAKWAIIRVILTGLFLISLEKQRQIIKEIDNVYSYSLRFLITSIVISMLIVTVGYISPKADAKWVDPTGWFSGFKGKGIINAGEKVQKVGYSLDDSYLGGSFIQDETIVMETVANNLVYWRGESKDQYTGHGWVNSNDIIATLIRVNDNEVSDILYFLMPGGYDIERKQVQQTVTFKEMQYNIIFTSGDIEKIILKNNDIIYINYGYGKIFFSNKLDGYYIETIIPVLDINMLQQSGAEYTNDELTYLQQFLQLPDSLPERVEELASNITSGYDNPYDKVSAIKNYLKQKYSYNIEDIPVPAEDEDFVDQFLFDSMEGYCDHFSSSMVVLARSVGIPARWVKGFAPGEIDYSREQKEFSGTVRNKDAHSWVEVYFSGIGWVPFEPTPGFVIPLEFIRNTSLTDDILLETPAFGNENMLDNKMNDNELNETADIISFNFNVKISWLIALLIIIFLIMVLRYRVEILFWWLKKILANEKSLNNIVLTLSDKMMVLLGRLKKKKEHSETVREYMESMSKKSIGNDLEEAIELFEIARYSSYTVSEKWRTGIWILWKRIMKNINLD